MIKRKSLAYFLVCPTVVSLMMLGSLAYCADQKLGRLLARQEVATTWIGLSEDELYLVRIVLLESGGGTVGYAFLDDPPVVQRVEAWDFDPKSGSRIRIGSSPEAALKISGDVVGVNLELTLSRGTWRRRVTLRREQDWERRWQRLRQSMETQ
jgi:hypothetical protein